MVVPSKSPSYRVCRDVRLSVAGLVVVLAMASQAPAVILYSSADRNTSEPTPDQGQDAWNLEATWGSYLATPVNATHFLAAQHVGVASNDVVLNGVTYQVNTSSGVADPNSDLEVFTLASGYSFPTWATLYNSAVNGSEIGKTITVIGRGTTRGDAVTVGSVTKGWTWGDYDGAKSWGQNVITKLTSYGSASNSLLYYTFDSNGIANECACRRAIRPAEHSSTPTESGSSSESATPSTARGATPEAPAIPALTPTSTTPAASTIKTTAFGR